ncbi:MAG: recombinase family protein [Oscillibacter sp.]|nr:recombinase family protein [Oscillibacter sp.]
MSKAAKPPELSGGCTLALYRRVSTDKQADEGYSLEVQREKLQAYAKTFSRVREIRDYLDDGYSGSSLDRPGMKRLIADIQAGRVTHVIVVKLDRLSRSQKDTLYLIEDVMLPANVAFISILESFNTDTAFGRAMVGILSVFAQLERENIFERTRGGMQKRVEKGYWPGGGRTPFGYDYDPARGILVPNGEAETVRHIYDRYLAGASMQTIADSLDLKYERVVYNILTRKSNAGYIVYNGREYRGLHEPIISLDTYERAMALLADRSAAKLVTKTDHLLTGLCRCGTCGAKMRYLKWGKAGYKLVCYSQQRSKPYLIRDPNCDGPSPFAEDVEDGVVRALFAATREKLAGARKAVESGSAAELLRERLKRAEAKLRRLYGLYGDSGDAYLLEAIGDAREEVGRVQTAIAEEASRGAESQAALNACQKLEGLEDAWPYMSVREQRVVLASVVESITISTDYTDIQLKFGLSVE